MTDSTSLVVAVSALFVALGLMERFAARALRARNDQWQQHYRRLPAGASIVAEFSWRGRAWITAFIDDSHSGTEPALSFISFVPLDERSRVACLRWLRAEGFDQAASSEPGHQRESFERFFPG